jgi:short-subunit dehydrogenase
MADVPLRTALITGASSGIGATYADRLAPRGHDLVLAARDRERTERLARNLGAESGVSIDVLSVDLTESRELTRIEARLREDGRIGLLINNAGATLAGGFANPDLDAQVRLIRLNVLQRRERRR